MLLDRNGKQLKVKIANPDRIHSSECKSTIDNERQILKQRESHICVFENYEGFCEASDVQDLINVRCIDKLIRRSVKRRVRQDTVC